MRKRVARIGFMAYLSLFVLAPFVGWAVGERISPLVPNPDYVSGDGPQIQTRCYDEYGPGGPIPECYDYDENPELVPRFGNPELYMVGAFWLAVIVLPKLKARFVKRFWTPS